MSSQPNQPEPTQFGDDELPEGLVADLRTAYASRAPQVPAALDAEILREARAGYSRRRRFRLAARAGIAAAAAAAAVAIGLPLLRDDKPADVPVAQAPVKSHLLHIAPAAAAEDVDHNGKVDIVDALVVAKLIEARAAIDGAYDVNGDGTVDRSDVDRIATAAVAVAPQGAEERRVQ